MHFDVQVDHQSDITFSSSNFHYPISNFYFADIVSKNSKIMAKCVEENMTLEKDVVVNQ